MDDRYFEVVTNYDMTPKESKSYQVCQFWMRQCHRVFGNIYYQKLPKKGDPRKSVLFKYCWKLVSEYDDKIADEHYELYVRAQLEILKGLSKANEGFEAMISPSCLIGKKAWGRWCVWKKHYEGVSRTMRNKPQKALPSKVKREIERTKSFLLSKFDNNITESKIIDAINTGKISRWYILRQISPYWLLTCETIKPFIKDLTEEFNLSIYESDLV